MIKVLIATLRKVMNWKQCVKVCQILEYTTCRFDHHCRLLLYIRFLFVKSCYEYKYCSNSMDKVESGFRYCWRLITLSWDHPMVTWIVWGLRFKIMIDRQTWSFVTMECWKQCLNVCDEDRIEKETWNYEEWGLCNNFLHVYHAMVHQYHPLVWIITWHHMLLTTISLFT